MKRILWVEMTASYHFSPNPKLYNPMLVKIISLLYTYYQLRGTEKLSTHIGASSVSSWQFSSDEWYSALWTDGECGLPSTTRGITVNSTSEKRRIQSKPAVCILLFHQYVMPQAINSSTSYLPLQITQQCGCFFMRLFVSTFARSLDGLLLK